MNCVNHPDQDAPYQCYRCKEFICVDCETKIGGRSVCPACLGQVRQRLAARYETETRDIRYGSGLVAGLGAALAMALVWSQLILWLGDLPALAGVALGGAVGYAVMWGAGGKRGPGLQQLAFVITLFGCLSSYLLIVLRAGLAGQMGWTGMDSPVLAAVYALPDYLVSVGVLDWLLVALGAIWSYWIPHARALPEE